MIDAHAIHATLGPAGWREVLLSTGIAESFLRDRHGPCPICGGKDRFRFDNKTGRGDWYCNQCGAGDGFKLVMGAQGINFADARKLVMSLARMSAESPAPLQTRATPAPQIERAEPTDRVRKLLRESCLIEDCEPALKYLASRKLWPLPVGHCLRAHASVPYWTRDEHEQLQLVGRFAALIAAVRDLSGELVTAHVTYLQSDGRKLDSHDPRKIVSTMNGREGCAVQLMPHGEVLGIAEGIETALSAARMHEIPVWAALNTSLLAKWEPPHAVNKVFLFADRDVAGLDAATKLMERLQERVRLVIKTPQAKDWNDALRAAA